MGRRRSVRKRFQNKRQRREYNPSERKEKQRLADQLDAKFGYERYTDLEPREAFLFNMRKTSIFTDEPEVELSCIDLYFVEQDGKTFKGSLVHNPYFLIQVKSRGESHLLEVESYLKRRFEDKIANVERVQKKDLSVLNHLAGIEVQFLKLVFKSVPVLLGVREELKPIILKNKELQRRRETYEFGGDSSANNNSLRLESVLDCIIDIREYDVKYEQRVSIDTGCRVGKWYTVSGIKGSKGIKMVGCEREARPHMKTLAYDIECTKAPLKFPNAEVDQIMMISYMLDGKGYLIINREIVSEDIDDFEYTPKPEYPGPFHIFNEKNEHDTIRRFIGHIKKEKPLIIVTYNGDFFDWPFVDKRAKKYGIYLYNEIGVWLSGEEYVGRFSVHMDAFHWVQRDSYLPQGSQGLKAVTRYKLGYDPIEVDPEDMLPFATEQPQKLAAYSVSDAVATYYLYMKYVHSFIFSLCTILPVSPSDVLRKGSGTLCELLLMVKSYEGNIVCPDKQKSGNLKFHKGHLLESETYIGGHVEGLESGVFRDDIPCKFRCNPEYIKELISGVDRIIKFAVCHEGGIEEKKIKNFDQVKKQIVEKLQKLHDQPNIECLPMIYHLDVGAMYPNIILTNRLQPMAIVDESVCAACDFNKPGKNCQRKMKWSWRGKYHPLSKSEFNSIRNQLSFEDVLVQKSDGDYAKENKSSKGGDDEKKTNPNAAFSDMIKKRFSDLTEYQKMEQIRKRVKMYSQKVYKRFTDEDVVEKEAIICQRENPFYVNTVRTFRDRRYMYKRLKKKWSKKISKAKNPVELQKAKDMTLLYDSMQLAHKCILNSFYGYVMRRGARWHSIEMAGVVTQTGANIIRDARHVVEQIGRPLELDTDGIWCILPCTFPENFTVETTDEKQPTYTFSYTNTLLNVGVEDKYTNHQYQDLDDEITRDYSTKSRCTIYFEVDGPYRCMVLPASKDEGKSIKKRYAVFNKDGSLAELKGFEIKRRGELQLIKIFQSEVFSTFLKGKSLGEVYEAVGDRANHWLDILDTEGEDLEDKDLFDLISEAKNMSGILAEYLAKGNKSTSITCAQRLAEFLGNEMVKDKGLNCKFIISKYPETSPVSQRAIPTNIFAAEDSIRIHYLKRWTRNNTLETYDIRSILDWGYYRTRLSSAIMKIITIPAAFQKVTNPVPRVEHPSWLLKRLRERDDKHKQSRIFNFFNKKEEVKMGPPQAAADIEDLTQFSQRSTFTSPLKKKFAKVRRRRRVAMKQQDDDGADMKVVSDENFDIDNFDIDKAMQSDDDEEEEKSNDDKENHALQSMEQDEDGNGVIESKNSSPPSPSEEQENAIPEPSNIDEFQDWIKQTKKQWRTDLARKRRIFKGLTTNNPNGSKILRGGKDGEGAGKISKIRLRDGLGSYLQDHASRVRTEYWQVLQVIENPSAPGLFRVWAIVGEAMKSFQVKVPRVIYINSRTENVMSEANAVKIATRTLPRRRQCLHLYQVTMEEKEFIKNMKQLGQFLARPDIEGVYETQVPLMFRFLKEIGCVCNLKKRKSDTAGIQLGNNEYMMDQLEYKTTTECSYLEPNISKLKIQLLYLYHSFTGGRHVFGLFFTNSSRALVVVANPGNAPLDKFNFEKGLRDAVDRSQCPHVNSRDFDFEISRVQSKDDAWEELNAAIVEYQSETKKSTVLLSQCASSLEEIYFNIPSLKSAFPVVSIASTAFDNQYPALQWFGHAARRMLHRYVSSFDWWKESVNLCRYAHVPIGNLPADHPAFVSDLFYARALSQSRHLLWLSDTMRPDLGGKEEDENMFEDEHANPESITRGCYRSVCVEIEVANLAVNAVMQEAQLDETEEVYFNTDTDLASFKVLKSMVTNWFFNCVHSENQFADMLLTHFYRWIRSPLSLLHDGALHRIIHTLMQKMFMHMTAKFRRLGSSVVYASFEKLIIDTKKMSVHRALSYCKYVIDSLKSREIFEWISLEPMHVWQALLFMDHANYGGLYHEGEVEDGGRDAGGMSQIERALTAKAGQATSSKEIHSNWDISRYLPTEVQKYFELAVSEFLYVPYQQVFDNDEEEPSMTVTDEKKLMEIQEKVSQMISCRSSTSFFPNKLFAIIRGLQKAEGTMEQPEELPGAHIKLGTAALEFIKFVSHVFALDKTVKREVGVLRKQMLKLANVQAYSEEAQFKNPCLTFILPDVICSYCNHCRDLDLCRDPDLIQHVWKCDRCEHQYDKDLIEASLVQIINKRHTNYQVQDLVCGRCGEVKVTNMGQYCACSGEYKNRSTPSDFRKDLIPFLNIAKYHKFEWLEETLHTCLDPVGAAPSIFDR